MFASVIPSSILCWCMVHFLGLVLSMATMCCVRGLKLAEYKSNVQ